MNTRHLLLSCVPLMVPLLSSKLIFSAEKELRMNALAKSYPDGLANLPPESQKAVIEYAKGWMSVFSTLRVSGLKKTDAVKKAYEQELLPLIESLKSGSKFEQDAFKAGTKVYDAIHYVGVKLAASADFDDSELNALIRYKKGDEADPSRLSAGIGELLFDYYQLVAPAVFEEAQRQIKSQAR